MKQLAFDFTAPPLPTLENFVTGGNAELAQNLRRLAAGGASERFIYAWGAPGCGRSHLLRAVVSAAQLNGASAAYISCMPGAGLPEGLERMDCVALDDVERLDAAQQVAVFHLYNTLRERQHSLLAAGAAPPVQLPLREDLVTRLGWGLVYQVHPLSDEDKVQAIAGHASTRGFRLPPDVCNFLLTRGRRDLPSLLATVDALDRYSLENRRQITVLLARELLGSGEMRAVTGRRAGDPGGAS